MKKHRYGCHYLNYHNPYTKTSAIFDISRHIVFYFIQFHTPVRKKTGAYIHLLSFIPAF